jgi:transposase
VPRNYGKNTPLVAALAPDGVHVPWMIEGAMDTATFAWYITEQLAPTLRPGQVVVLDNLSVHKAERIRQAIEARQCHLLFLPPLYRKLDVGIGQDVAGRLSLAGMCGH